MTNIDSILKNRDITLSTKVRLVKAIYCHPAYLTYNAEYIMRNAMLLEAQAGIKIAWRNINNLRYTDDTTLMEKVKQN